MRSAGDAFRYRREVGAESCRLIFNINAEFAAPMAPRPLPDVARSVVFSSMPDALCVSGPITGQPADASGLAEVAQAVTGSGVPVLVNTGLRASNAAELLRFADGAIVGSSLKPDGVTWNPVDPARVRELMDVVRGLRSQGTILRHTYLLAQSPLQLDASRFAYQDARHRRVAIKLFSDASCWKVASTWSRWPGATSLRRTGCPIAWTDR